MARSTAERSQYGRRACGRALLALMLVLALLPWSGPAHAAPTFAVNSTLDEPDAFVGNGVCSSTPSGVCTLRAAVQEGQAVNRAVTVPAGYYTLTNGQLAVTQNLTLTGAGSGKTILDGNLANRVFDIAASGFVYLGGVTVQYGRGGPGYLGHQHGGGIHNHGTLILVDSTIRTNAVYNGTWGGGGIFSTGNAILENVTISGNATSANGGGIENGGTGTLDLYNVTIINNSAAAGGGIKNNATADKVHIQNSIVANNSSGGNCSGAMTSNGYNLDSAATCGFPAGRSNVNPLLGALSDSDTYPPLPGSPAIDAGNPAAPGSGGSACPSKDQRGVTRPQDGNSNGIATCDIGAYEVVPPDLSISYMADSPDPVQAGSSLIYTIDVNNPGPATLTNLQLTDNLPAGVTYTGFAETRGGSCGHASGGVTCNLATLDGNRVWTIYIYTTVNPATAGTINNTASVTATGIDPNPRNNTAAESTTVTPLPSVHFSAASYSANENAGTATIIVQLSAASDQSVTVHYGTSNGTAAAPGDYTATNGTLTFNPGQTSKTFSVTIINDTATESNETLNLSLSSPSNASLSAPSSATLTIQDNDTAPAPSWWVYLPLVMR